MPTQRNNGLNGSGRLNIPDPMKPAKTRKQKTRPFSRDGVAQQGDGPAATKPTKRQGVTKRTLQKGSGESGVLRSQTFRPAGKSGVLMDQERRLAGQGGSYIEHDASGRVDVTTGALGRTVAQQERETGRLDRSGAARPARSGVVGTRQGQPGGAIPGGAVQTARGQHPGAPRQAGSLRSQQIPRVNQDGQQSQGRAESADLGATARRQRATVTGRSGVVRSQQMPPVANGASQSMRTGVMERPTGTTASQRLPKASVSRTLPAAGTAEGAAVDENAFAVSEADEATERSYTVRTGAQRPRTSRQTGARRSVKGSAQRGSTTGGSIKNKILVPLVAVVALFVLLGVGDLVTSIGKVHAGVTVQGVDVGGLTEQEASEKIVAELTPSIEKTKVTIYENAELAALDGVDLSNSGVEKAYAAKENAGSDIDGDGSVDKWKITADTVGMYIDGDALAKDAYSVGRSLDFFRERLGAWLFGSKVDASVSISPERYDDLAAEINKVIGKEIVDSKAVVTDGKAELKKGHDGLVLNQQTFEESLSRAVFGDVNAFAAPMEKQERRIKPATAKRVVKQINEAISQEVTVEYEGETWTLGPEELGGLISQMILEPGQSLSIGNGTQKVLSADEARKQAGDEAEDGDDAANVQYDLTAGTDKSSGWILQPYVNQKKADNYLVSILGDKALGGAKDATFYIKNGKVKIKPSKEGKGPDRKPAELQLQNTLFGGQTSVRTIKIEDTVIQPQLTTEEAQGMGIKEKLASWSISSPGSEARQHNLMQMCKYINKSLVAPGQVWSFIETVGEMTEERGFKKAPVIVNGRHEDGIGGGACQVASCVFNCACFSGLGIESRTNHDFYIAAYDDRGFADATVSWDSLDFKWLNDMQNYILVTAEGDGDEVKVEFWGTDEGRKVTCDRGKWKKGESYKSIRENNDELAAGTTRVEQSGVNGRSIVIHYIAEDKDGKVLHDIQFNSEYVAQNEIISVGTKTS